MEFHRHPHTFVGQVSIKVQDLKRALAFYQEVIGFQILNQTERSANLTADGKKALLSLEQPENVVPKQRNTTGLYHFALLLPKRSDLGRVLQHLINISYPIGASDHYVSEALYLNDPDGNGIEIYADRKASEWTWQNGQVSMATEPLDAQSVLAEGKGEAWSVLPAETVMGHIHLHVSHLKNTEEFYEKGLGFQVVTRYGKQALFMSTGGYHHHIGLNTWAGEGAPAPEVNSVGLRKFTLVFPSEEARAKVIQQLTKIGAPVKEKNGEIITSDPSGNNIQLII
ncbi:VOC family protein [Bacillus sp. UMB0893]|uniref:VOC family protein n=1 Tax=Bacillus sp. UMB0893 TaxID=2066053 RepID=UPI000C78A7D0|nr:VOC family protein [Bacillus sp. UMB0893]PLR69044.1 glyoxalase [Bacillus sp. UMB0893]